MCFAPPAPSGAVWKTCRESITTQLTPILYLIASSGLLPFLRNQVQDVGTCPKDEACTVIGVGNTTTNTTTSYCAPQVRAMLDRAVDLHGQIDTWDADLFERFEPILTGMTEADITKLPMAALSVVRGIRCFHADQLKCLGDRAMDLLNGTPGWDLTTILGTAGATGPGLGAGFVPGFAAMFSQLGQLMGGFTSDKLDLLDFDLSNATGIANSVAGIGESSTCPLA